MTVDSKITLTISSIFKGEGFTKATQATSKLSKDVKDAGGAIKDLAGSMGQLGGEVGKVAGGAGKLMSLLGAGPVGLLVAGVTAIVTTFVKWKNAMKEVTQKMEELGRTRMDYMWERMFKRIKDATKAQSEFFDTAIQKGRTLLQFSKEQSSADQKVRDAQYNDQIEIYRQNQAKADAELAQKKRANLSNPNLTRDEAEYLNKQLDLDNQKQHIDTERRIANETHKMRMENSQTQLRELQKEKEQLEKEAQMLYQKDEAAKRSAKAEKEGLLKQAKSLEFDAQGDFKRQHRRRKGSYEDSLFDSRRQRYYEGEAKVDEWNKKIQQKKDEAAQVEENYVKQNQEMVKRQSEINHRHNVILKEIEALEKRMQTQNKSFDAQNKTLDAKYHDAWSKIEEASKQRTAREAMKKVESANAQVQRNAQIEASGYKNSEFKALVMAMAEVTKVTNKIQMFQTTRDPNDKTGKTLAQSNVDEYNKLLGQLKDASLRVDEAKKQADLKRNTLWSGAVDIAMSHDTQNIKRAEKEMQEVRSRMG